MVQDLFLLLMRWAHALAALLWIGGSLFYALVLPAARQTSPHPEEATFFQALGREFRSWVNLCIGILVLTGAILTLARLAQGQATPPYLVVLGVKVSLALGAFLLVRSQGRRPAQPGGWARRALTRTNLILVLGLLAFLLADVLQYLVERHLQGG